MLNIKNILSETLHRPYSLPDGDWSYYQEWNNVLFLHWKVPYSSLRKLVPSALEIEGFDGEYYISLVAFTMQKIRPKFLPAVALVSDFHEINLRTYVVNGNKQGVYFLNIEGGKALSVFIAKHLSKLPYEKAAIHRIDNVYKSANRKKRFILDIDFVVKEKLSHKSSLEKWLTERYCLFLERRGKIYRYDIHHKEWEIKSVDIKNLNLNYKVGNLDLSQRFPDLTHYSDGVKVLAWKKQLVQ